MESIQTGKAAADVQIVALKEQCEQLQKTLRWGAQLETSGQITSLKNLASVKQVCTRVI